MLTGQRPLNVVNPSVYAPGAVRRVGGGEHGVDAEFVGHPLIEQFQNSLASRNKPPESGMLPNILLLPGSRKSELYRHLPILFQAMRRIAAVMPARWRIVLPNETLTYILVKCLLAELDGPKPHVTDASFSGAEGLGAVQALAKKVFPDLAVQIGDLPDAVAHADVAIAKTGTVTMECACAGVPPKLASTAARCGSMNGK